MSVINNSLFCEIHSDSSGAVFNIKNINLKIFSCAFQKCTAKTSAACFLLSSSAIQIIDTCFYYSQILTSEDNSYGNAFHIIDGERAYYSQISSFLCGYDSSKCSDSTFVTSNTPLISTHVNCSHSATYSGSNSITVNSLSETSNITYLITCSVFGNGAHHFITQKAKALLENFVCINSSRVGTLFWVDVNDFITINNGIFIGPEPESIVNDNRHNNLQFIKCKSEYSIKDVSEEPILIDGSNYNIEIIKLAEYCDIITSKLECSQLNRYHTNIFYNKFTFIMILSSI